LAPFGGAILQPIKAVLHVADAAFEAIHERLVGQGGADDGGNDFVKVGQALNGIGEGLLIDLRVMGPDAVADGPVGAGGKLNSHCTDSGIR